MLITLGGNTSEWRIGSVVVAWSPGGLRDWLHNQLFRRDGLESLAQLAEGGAVARLHAGKWGSARALCGIDDSLHRSRGQWGDEFPKRHFREAERYNAAFARCQRCLELAPVESNP